MAIKLKSLKKKLLHEGKITEQGLALAGIKLMLSELIYNLRHAKKMSQKKLAMAIGVSQPYIAKIESGEENLTIETIAKILSALHMSLEIRPHIRKKKDEILHIAKAA